MRELHARLGLRRPAAATDESVRLCTVRAVALALFAALALSACAGSERSDSARAAREPDSGLAAPGAGQQDRPDYLPQPPTRPDAPPLASDAEALLPPAAGESVGREHTPTGSERDDPATPDTAVDGARAPPSADTDGGLDGEADGPLVGELLSQLTVAPETPAGYDRTLFRHWVTTDGCPARSHVLIRDSGGTAVTGDRCTVTAGLWYSPFDDMWVDVPSSIDIDHVVPLAEAWRSGADRWDEAARRAFANDLADPRTLIAVTASSNRSKGDRDPADWLPPNVSFQCEYVGTWVAVKHRWDLSVDVREKAAIRLVLDGCGKLRTAPVGASRPPSASPPPAPELSPQPSAQVPVVGVCVDVNTASVDDLKRIVHIGLARAAELVSLRPFESVDALSRISGIGAGRLADIKAQGLACVP